MKAYVRTRAIIPAFLFAYFWLSFFGPVLSEKLEFFPVFNWSLFSIVRDEVTLVDLEVMAIDGEPLPIPTRYYELGDRFADAARKNIMFQKLLVAIHRAVTAGNERKFWDRKALLEKTYLSGHGAVRYRIVVARFNPIVRWRSGRLDDLSVIGVYDYREGGQ